MRCPPEIDGGQLVTMGTSVKQSQCTVFFFSPFLSYRHLYNAHRGGDGREQRMKSNRSARGGFSLSD